MTTLTLDNARSMLDRALARAQELDVAVSIAVVDAGGHVNASARMDGAGFQTPDIARGKAWTSAAFRAPSGAIEANMQAAPAFAGAVATTMRGDFMPRQGALPVPGGGALGVSGATSAQDEDIAQYAINNG
jgi:uncharacterized protein GlcG (DUF336 family)